MSGTARYVTEGKMREVLNRALRAEQRVLELEGILDHKDDTISALEGQLRLARAHLDRLLAATYPDQPQP